VFHEDDDGQVDAGWPAGADGGGGNAALVRAGIVPLVDCAPLVAAARKGFAAAEGLTIELARQTSWASLRDRLAVGRFDVAQMLAPMPIAANLGAGGLAVPTVVPMALARGGNAITVSTGLWAEMAAEGGVLGAGPAALGAALARVVARRGQPPTLAMVHPFSAHNYELRYWLAACGIDPERDVRLVVVPPPYVGEAMASGQIDGFCVGEPWNSLAVESGAGVLILAASEIWHANPCKVLGIRADWAEAHPARLVALLRAVDAAARWADDPANRRELAHILSEPDVLGVDAALIERSLAGRLLQAKGGPERHLPDFFAFHRDGVGHPTPGHALWFYSQMVRWGQVAGSPEAERAAARTYRPDLFRAALGGVEPQRVPELFFDGGDFDPDDLAGYLGSLPGPAASIS
jgi:ABC-type nitrate/sulfonate/bicarbonate transport system substrate-binding protein